LTPSRAATRRPSAAQKKEAVKAARLGCKPLGPQPWKPHGYQKKAIKFLLEHAAAGLFLDPGLGKTSITLGAFKILQKQGAASRMLVVVPLRPATLVWPPEVQKWKDFAHMKVVVLHGPKKEKLLAEGAEADVVVINPEGLDWLFDVRKAKDPRTGKVKITVNPSTRFRGLGVDTLAVDEATKFKHSQSQRFKILASVLDCFDRRWALTGAPAAGGLMDLFGIMYVVDQGRALGRFITHYRNAYFTPTGYGGYTWVPQEGAKERIFERIAPTVLRMDADDYLELPQVIPSVCPILLPEKVRRLYDELEDEFIAELEANGMKIVAQNAGASLVKCRQIANGGIYLDREVDEKGRKTGPRGWTNLHDEKVQAALDYRDEILGNQLMVTYDFEHDLDRLLLGFGKDTPYFGGGLSDRRARELEGAWNAGEIDTLLVQLEAVARGLNLQGSNAQHIFMHSLTYNYETYDQLIRRLRRQGNTAKRIFVKHAVAKDTVDEAMMQSVGKKAGGQNEFFKYLKDYARKRRPAMA
jgi:SNF2 family DNA or RNA helicase